jgi:divalent metal cation (Fe/Co/Zn/Cd) transporter
MRFVDLHLTVHKDLTVQESHALVEEIEARIQDALNKVDVTIHVEPDGN